MVGSDSSRGGEEPGWVSSGSPGGERVVSALLEGLLGENQTTKLVYLYLKPHGEVAVSVRQLEALLGI